ncbi:MAG: antibiotic biosynthesis monooxygenase [Acidobacteria bacterium]|nr:antibiotic biosynthesis monooxygenase [Acidobacteriota bacterium]
MIIVLGHVVVQDGRMSEALELSQSHVQRSRVEPGCITHHVYLDPENPCRLVFVEQWADRAALDQHFKVPASRDFVMSLSAMAAEPPSMSLFDAEQLLM